MDDRHPKRRKDKYNPYTLTIEKGRHYLSFRDGQGVHHKIEIDSTLYALMDSFELDDLSHLNEWDRHIEQSELTDSTLEQRMLEMPETVEDSVWRKIRDENLHKALDELPMVPRRRVILYFFYDLTYEEIAKIEGCTVMPIKRSIDRALKKIKKFFESRG